REPAFVDAAAIRAVGVGVVWMQLDAQAGLEERARHPVGRQAKQTAGAGEFGFDFGSGVGLEGFERSDGIDAHGQIRCCCVEIVGRIERIGNGFEQFSHDTVAPTLTMESQPKTDYSPNSTRLLISPRNPWI